jgi:uncharacterized membrane protein
MVLERLRNSFSDRRLAALAALALLSLFSAATVVVRVAYTGSPRHLGIVWNLALAWIPVVLALVVYDRSRAGAPRLTLVTIGGLWLLFLPNAPYLVTDLKHIEAGAGVPVWYDVVLLASAAWAGLVLGFLSLYLMQAVVRRFAGATIAWIFVGAALVLSSLGIYIGRFLRLNSWDVFVQPGSLLADVGRGLINPLDYPRPLAVTALFTSFLLAGYLVFYAFAHASLLVRE